VNISLRFASGEQPVFDGSMYADVYRGGNYIDTLFLTSENELQSTLFRFIYQPSYNGIYYFELYLDDTYHLSSQFVMDTSFTYTGEGPIPGEQSINGFENDAILTFPLIIAMVGAASGAVITTSKTKYFKKDKNKLKTIVK